MPAYYNEIDPFAAEWLRQLIKGGHIADGEVDERSIEDVLPNELRGFTQCHFFAGIGVWSHALRRAGWGDERPVWTGSCPCQPFSSAGKGKGTADERHLWPTWFHLISQCRPAVIFGEQVSSKDGLGWLDGLYDDLQAEDYALAALDVPASAVGAPHIRQRLFFVAENSMLNEHRKDTPNENLYEMWASKAFNGFLRGEEGEGRKEIFLQSLQPSAAEKEVRQQNTGEKETLPKCEVETQGNGAPVLPELSCTSQSKRHSASRETSGEKEGHTLRLGSASGRVTREAEQRGMRSVRGEISDKDRRGATPARTLPRPSRPTERIRDEQHTSSSVCSKHCDERLGFRPIDEDSPSSSEEVRLDDNLIAIPSHGENTGDTFGETGTGHTCVHNQKSEASVRGVADTDARRREPWRGDAGEESLARQEAGELHKRHSCDVGIPDTTSEGRSGVGSLLDTGSAEGGRAQGRQQRAATDSVAGGLPDAERIERERCVSGPGVDTETQSGRKTAEPAGLCSTGRLRDPVRKGLERHTGDGDDSTRRSFKTGPVATTGAVGGFWSDCDWLDYLDAKQRPVEPGTFPLAHGITNRMGLLRGYGNAIVGPVATGFIEAYLDTQEH